MLRVDENVLRSRDGTGQRDHVLFQRAHPIIHRRYLRKTHIDQIFQYQPHKILLPCRMRIEVKPIFGSKSEHKLIDSGINKFDIKDLLFAALAMNLSNFNLANGKNPDVRIIIIGISALFIAFIGASLGVFLRNEAEKTIPFPTVLFVSSIVFSVLSVIVSFEANNYTFKNIRS